MAPRTQVHSEPVNVASWGKRSLQMTWMRLSWVRVGFTESVLTREEKGGDTQGGVHVKTEAEAGGMWPQAKGVWSHPGLQEAKKYLPPEPGEEGWPC